MIKDSVHSGLITDEKFKRNTILINGNFNYDFDIQKHLNELQEKVDSKDQADNSWLQLLSKNYIQVRDFFRSKER